MRQMHHHLRTMKACPLKRKAHAYSAAQHSSKARSRETITHAADAIFIFEMKSFMRTTWTPWLKDSEEKLARTTSSHYALTATIWRIIN
jgi:hypothetical protein